MNITTLQKITGQPTGKKELLKMFHNTGDIVAAVMEQHEINKGDAVKLAKHFDTGNDTTTCRRLWEFVHFQLNYKAEQESQTVKTISKILSDANGKGNDCKHFAGFTAAILEALKIPFFYRFASYTDKKTPTHVYIIAEPDGRQICLDSVLPYFDTEKPYQFKTDLNPKKNMPLYRMSGINDPAEVGSLKSFVQDVVKKVTTTVQKAAPKVLHAGAFVYGAASRGAFEGLVLLNAFGLANKLQEAINKNPSAFRAFWYKLGGDYDKIVNIVSTGAKKPKIGNIKIGIDQNSVSFNQDYAAVGEPATTAAAITAAIPTLILVLNFLRSSNIDGSAIQAALTNAGVSDENAASVANLLQQFGQNNNLRLPPPGYNNFNQYQYQQQTGAAGLLSNPIIWIIAGAGIYFVTRKK